MFQSLSRPWRKWRESRLASHQLDAILAQFESTRSLAERNEWLIELAYWLRRADRPQRYSSESWQYARLRYLLQVLEHNPPAAERVGRTLRSLLEDNDPISLLCDTGLSSRTAFWSELLDRWQARFLRPAPSDGQLSTLFALIFVGLSDARWVSRLDDQLLSRLHSIFRAGLAPSENANYETRLERALGISIQILISQVQAAGLSTAVRSRLGKSDVTQSPFYQLADATTPIFRNRPEQAEVRSGDLALQLTFLRAVLDRCRTATASVYQHLCGFR